MAHPVSIAIAEDAAMARHAKAAKTLAKRFGVDPPAEVWSRDPHEIHMLELRANADFLEALANASTPVEVIDEDPHMDVVNDPLVDDPNVPAPDEAEGAEEADEAEEPDATDAVDEADEADAAKPAAKPKGKR